MRPHDDRVDALALASSIRSMEGDRYVAARALLGFGAELRLTHEWDDAVAVYREAVRDFRDDGFLRVYAEAAQEHMKEIREDYL